MFIDRFPACFRLFLSEHLMFLLDGDETGADKYLSLFCEKSKTAEEYVRRWIPIVAATRSVECGDSARDMLNGWISEN